MKMRKNNINSSRRSFIRKSSTAAMGSVVAMNVLVPKVGKAMTTDTLKVGLIGCGGRGTGAANQALNADDNVILTQMADAFEDRLQSSLLNITKEQKDKVKVAKSGQHVGLDAYKKVIESDVDVVILTTPPNFRPAYLKAAVEAGKHVFCEKPMAVDAPGLRSVLESAKLAKKKNLNLVSGFCWRYDTSMRETYKRILAGDIGEIKSVYSTYNTGELWSVPWEPGWSEMEGKMRNWLYYNWLSGDHIIEQAIHSVDLGSWAMGDAKPVSCSGTGGRQVRTDPKYGNIYDHFAVVFDYDNGAKSFHFSRQQQNCERAYSCEAWGTDGRAIIDVIRRRNEIIGPNPWRYRGEGNNMYQQEHDELFAAIRDGSTINDGDWMVQSNLMGLMARMAAYTGQKITYEEALNSKEQLGPNIEDYTWDMKYKDPPVAMPGITKFT